MENLISITGKNSMLSIVGLPDIPVPYVTETRIMESCYIAGLYYRDDPISLVNSITPGDTLVMEREPQNEFDDHAIAVRTVQGDFLGYIPQKKNEVIANLMDAGKMVYAKVIHAEAFPELSVRMDIYMKD